MLTNSNDGCDQLSDKSEKHEALGISYGDMLRVVTSPEVERILAEGNHKSECLIDSTGIEIRLINETNGQVWLRYKIRERVVDGTPQFTTSPLTDWDYSQVIDQIHLSGERVVEESTYWTDPRHPHQELFEEELAGFITNPFEILFNATPERWLYNFQRVIHQDNPPRPGSLGLARIGGLRKFIDGASKVMLSNKGISYLSAVPTWHHVALLYEYLGFQYACTSDQINLNQINKHLTLREFDIRDAKASWLVMLQFWAEKVQQDGLNPSQLCPEQFLFYNSKGEIITYNLRPGRNVWMISKI